MSSEHSPVLSPEIHSPTSEELSYTTLSHGASLSSLLDFETDKKIIILNTQTILIKYKREFTDSFDLFTHINNSLYELEVETKNEKEKESLEKDLTKYFHDLIIELINKKEHFNNYCKNLKEIQIIDDLNKGTIIPLTTVPLIELEMNSIIKIVSDTMILIKEVRKQIQKHNKKQKGNGKVLNYYS
jgi:uncharacterized protein (UPF0128 family)